MLPGSLVLFGSPSIKQYNDFARKRQPAILHSTDVSVHRDHEEHVVLPEHEGTS